MTEVDRWGDTHVMGGFMPVKSQSDDTLYEHPDYGFPDGEKAV